MVFDYVDRLLEWPDTMVGLWYPFDRLAHRFRGCYGRWSQGWLARLPIEAIDGSQIFLQRTIKSATKYAVLAPTAGTQYATAVKNLLLWLGCLRLADCTPSKAAPQENKSANTPRFHHVPCPLSYIRGSVWGFRVVEMAGDAGARHARCGAGRALRSHM